MSFQSIKRFAKPAYGIAVSINTWKTKGRGVCFRFGSDVLEKMRWEAGMNLTVMLGSGER